MKNFKKNICFILIFMLALTTFVGCDSSSGELEDGLYTGTAQGHNAEIEVEVTIDEGDIAGIEIVSHEETPVLSDPVFNDLKDMMVEHNSINIDMVSGATITSMGLRNAVKAAMEEAGATEEYFDQGKNLSLDYGAADEEKEYDVVVVGAGGAGMIAAIEAKSQGAEVAIIEKNPFVGGNTLVSGGEFNAPNSWVQEIMDVEDSVEQYIEDTLSGGDYKADEDLVRIMAENITEDGEWLRDFVEVEFIEDYLMHFGGHSVPRAIYPIGGSGIELIQKLERKIYEMEIPLYLEMEASEIMVDENERVVGIKAQNPEGESVHYYGVNGVVLTTGGFGANLEMVQEHNDTIDERYMSTNQKGATGDGIIMAKDIGADVRDMEYVQTYPTCNPRTGHLSYVADTRFDGAILVNKEGERFVEELDRRDVISEAILAQTESYGYLMWDETIRQNSNMDSYLTEFESLENQDLIVKADTIEEAAEFFGIEVETLKKTIEKYNGFAEQGQDEDFQRRGSLVALEEGPYYIQKVVPAIHHTMGGLKINGDTQVISTDGEWIEGLYAAGELTGGIHGKNRLGGNAISDLIVFGRIAGRNAAQ
ncbi:flavocytochrome c [Proteinivorax tanatarense]|uniref:Urocanate reductase n=1 Tax=Proteinivorax tanatarense TaxID=1260629 RepID=A0AAU7VKQ8_9FIRM